MRRLILAGAALVAVPAFAFAGPIAKEGNLTLQVEAKYKPVKASKKGKPARAIRFDYRHTAGTVDGSGLPDFRRITVETGGPKFAFGSVPYCVYSEVAEQGPSACPEGSQVGRGSGTAELHGPTGNQDVEVDLDIYNGDIDIDENGANRSEVGEGILLVAHIDGTPLATIPMDALPNDKGVELRNPEEDPNPDTSFPYGIKEVEIVIDKRKNEQGVAYLGAPTKCKKKWVVATTMEPYTGDEIRATDKVKCTKPLE